MPCDRPCSIAVWQNGRLKCPAARALECPLFPSASLVLAWAPVVLQQHKLHVKSPFEKWPRAELESAKRCWCREKSTVLATEDNPLQRRITEALHIKKQQFQSRFKSGVSDILNPFVKHTLWPSLLASVISIYVGVLLVSVFRLTYFCIYIPLYSCVQLSLMKIAR